MTHRSSIPPLGVLVFFGALIALLALGLAHAPPDEHNLKTLAPLLVHVIIVVMPPWLLLANGKRRAAFGYLLAYGCVMAVAGLVLLSLSTPFEASPVVSSVLMGTVACYLWALWSLRSARPDSLDPRTFD